MEIKHRCLLIRPSSVHCLWATLLVFIGRSALTGTTDTTRTERRVTRLDLAHQHARFMMDGACRLLDNDGSKELQNNSVASVDYRSPPQSLLILRLGQWCGSALALWN